jgi:hypothetical protein
MKTLLNTNSDVIIESEFVPIDGAKIGEKCIHNRKIQSITIYDDIYDNSGIYKETKKILIHSGLLKEILKEISEIESESCIMKKQDL